MTGDVVVSGNQMATVSSGSLLIRRARPDDVPALCGLFAEAFSRSLTEAKWRWKLGDQTQGPANVFVAEREGEIIGQYAGIPVDYRSPWGPLKGIVSVDTMTSPGHRRQGILTALGAHCVEAWRNAGFEFVVGMPNANFGSRASLMGWTPLTALVNIIRPLSPLALAAQKLGFAQGATSAALAQGTSWLQHQIAQRGLRGGLQIRQWYPDDDIPIPEFQAPHPQFIEVRRDIRWLRWRFGPDSELDYRIFTATREGRVVAWSVLRAPCNDDPQVAALPEIVYGPGSQNAARALVHHCAAVASQLGATKLQSLVQADSARAVLLKSSGFWFPRERLAAQVIPLTPDTSLWCQTPLNPKIWALQASDFDIQ